MLNRVVGLGVHGPATEEQLDAAIDTMTGLRFYVSVSPDAQPADITDWLRDRGFEPGWGWMQFRRGLEDVPEPETTLDVVEIGLEHADDFARVVRVAYGLPRTSERVIGAAVAHDAWTCWVAYAGDEPAASRGALRRGGRRLPRLRGHASRAPGQGSAGSAARRPHPARQGAGLRRRVHRDRRAALRPVERLVPEHPPLRLRGAVHRAELAEPRRLRTRARQRLALCDLALRAPRSLCGRLARRSTAATP